MALNATYYLDAGDLSSATSVYLDLGLVNLAPDGVYGDGTITREQSSGILLTAAVCETCSIPCGGGVNAEGGEGVYIINVNAGTDTGAIIVRFFPQNVPDGIRVTYDGTIYNKLSSPAYGLLQSSNYGHYTMIGASSSVSSCSSWYPLGATITLDEFLYNGTAFLPTGATEVITIDVGDIALTATSPLYSIMVIPKITASPNLMNIQVVGACVSTLWNIVIDCPALLPSFLGSVMFATDAILCETLQNETYYFVSVANTPLSYIDLYDYIFLDAYGEFPAANGFYLTDATDSVNNVIEVSNGIVVGITKCN